MSAEVTVNKGAWSEKINSYPLKTRAKLVLSQLINRSNRESLDCFPSLKTISEDCGMSIPTVQRALNDLIEFGLLEKIYRFEEGTGRQTSNLYKLKLEPEKSKPKDTKMSIQKQKKKMQRTPLKINAVKTITQNKSILVPEYKNEKNTPLVFKTKKVKVLHNIKMANVNSTTKYVAQRLLHRANKNLTCFPSLKTIAEDTNLCKQTVRKSISILIQNGLLKKVDRFDKRTKRRTSNLYQFILNPNTIELEGTSAAEADRKKVNDVVVKAKKLNARTIALEKVFEIKEKRLGVNSQIVIYKSLIKDNKNLVCHPRSKKLEMSYSKTTIQKAINNLLDRKLLQRKKTVQNTNIYRLIIVSKGMFKNNRTKALAKPKSSIRKNISHGHRRKQKSKLNSINTS